MTMRVITCGVGWAPPPRQHIPWIWAGRSIAAASHNVQRLKTPTAEEAAMAGWTYATRSDRSGAHREAR